MRVKDAVGRFGEQVARRYLRNMGWTILDTNWRCADGELDVVALDGDVLVFVEVKTRSTLAYGDPAEAVDSRKAQRIRALALRWIDERRASESDCFWRELRFDVVTVVRRDGAGGLSVRYLPGAF